MYCYILMNIDVTIVNTKHIKIDTYTDCIYIKAGSGKINNKYDWHQENTLFKHTCIM